MGCRGYLVCKSVELRNTKRVISRYRYEYWILLIAQRGSAARICYKGTAKAKCKCHKTEVKMGMCRISACRDSAFGIVPRVHSGSWIDCPQFGLLCKANMLAIRNWFIAISQRIRWVNLLTGTHRWHMLSSTITKYRFCNFVIKFSLWSSNKPIDGPCSIPVDFWAVDNKPNLLVHRKFESRLCIERVTLPGHGISPTVQASTIFPRLIKHYPYFTISCSNVGGWERRDAYLNLRTVDARRRRQWTLLLHRWWKIHPIRIAPVHSSSEHKGPVREYSA